MGVIKLCTKLKIVHRRFIIPLKAHALKTNQMGTNLD